MLSAKRLLIAGLALLGAGLWCISAPAQFGAVKPLVGGSCTGNDSFTKILLHFDGTNGSTTIPDTNRGAPITWTAAGASLTTSNFKFGTASLASTGNSVNSGVDSASYELSSVEWTIDYWTHSNGSTTAAAASGQQAGSTSAANSSVSTGRNATTNTMRCSVPNGSLFTTVTSTSGFGAAWNHFACQRRGNDLDLFFNGTREATTAFSGTVPNSAVVYYVGRSGQTGETQYTGLIDEFRLSVGIARYPSTGFSVPTQSYCP